MNWLEALKATAIEFDQPMIWGKTDCCQFINAYYERVKGIRFDFDYTSEYGAKKILLQEGGLSGLLHSVLGEPGELAEGAIVITTTPEDEPSAGIYNGYCVWTMNDTKGLIRMPIVGIEEAWPQA